MPDNGLCLLPRAGLSKGEWTRLTKLIETELQHPTNHVGLNGRKGSKSAFDSWFTTFFRSELRHIHWPTAATSVDTLPEYMVLVMEFIKLNVLSIAARVRREILEDARYVNHHTPAGTGHNRTSTRNSHERTTGVSAVEPIQDEALSASLRDQESALLRGLQQRTKLAIRSLNSSHLSSTSYIIPRFCLATEVGIHERPATAAPSNREKRAVVTALQDDPEPDPEPQIPQVDPLIPRVGPVQNDRHMVIQNSVVSPRPLAARALKEQQLVPSTTPRPINRRGISYAQLTSGPLAYSPAMPTYNRYLDAVREKFNILPNLVVVDMLVKLRGEAARVSVTEPYSLWDWEEIISLGYSPGDEAEVLVWFG